MRPSALDRLSAENMGILRLADDIALRLGRPATSRDLEHLAFRIIDANEQIIRPHVGFEGDVLLRTLADHLGGMHNDLIARSLREAGAIENQILALREAVELVRPLREVLEDTEFVLRDYVDYAESTLIPYARRHLGDLINEVERRHQAEASPDLVLD